ncbi:bifunctional DNA primase/polymerase [Nonomuraea rhizosphaerae]|uniref:bifunctional DNA primase/polymerase n=1 Tax=Nonomuraea rhizosphaerae TaxID=2665663 RepID=UPI001C5CC7AB|nr:bifunctional DNA primase/polymerase [Nonomuraea rhizosphaerae]
MNSNSTTLRYALAAAARGWHVFPLTPGDKTPLPGMSWKRLATTDPQVIARIWARRPYNIGIACGPSRLLVIDLDKPKAGEEELRPPPPWDLPGVADGADVFALVCQRAGQPLPYETFTVRTRRGGLHRYFTTPTGPDGGPDAPALGNTSGDKGNGLGWHIDTRGAGGFVVGPGSHVSLPDGTGTYTVIHARDPAPLPTWLAERLRPTFNPPRPPATIAVHAGQRGAYLEAAIRGCLARITAAREGERNTTVWGASVALGQLVAGGALDEAETEALLLQAAMQAGLSEHAARKTICSGFRRGATRPRHVPA